MNKDPSNNKIKLVIPKKSKIKKPPLLLCNNPHNNIHQKMFRNNTLNHIYTMNRFKQHLDYNSYNINKDRKRKPMRNDLFKKWVQDIDKDYDRNFGKNHLFIDDFDFNLYPEKPRLPPIIEKRKVNINVELNNLDDLIKLTDKYPMAVDVEYNINMQAIHNIKIPVTKLNNMIGMKKLKESVLDQIIYFIQDLHLNNKDFMHTVIAGPPGTGKTEIAKIMGELFSNLGILKKKKFKKVTRSDLIAGYLGQTALKTRDVIKESLGGVLFIDEAYALGNQEKRDSFAKECIDTLCEALSDHKDNLMVIIAGYENDLNKCFFSYNKGLDSRFTWRFKTDDYNANELNRILNKKINDISWNNDKIKNSWFENKMKYFSYYGRDMETLLAKIKIAHSRRVFCLDEKEKKHITQKDLDKGFEMFLDNDEVKKRDTTNIINHMYC